METIFPVLLHNPNDAGWIWYLSYTVYIIIFSIYF